MPEEFVHMVIWIARRSAKHDAETVKINKGWKKKMCRGRSEAHI